MEYIINDTEKVIEYNNKRNVLPRKQFEMFKYFYNNKGRMISREELLRNIWEQDVIVCTRTIDVHIRRIRKTFPEAPIVTRKCYGYMWENN